MGRSPRWALVLVATGGLVCATAGTTSAQPRAEASSEQQTNAPKQRPRRAEARSEAERVHDRARRLGKRIMRQLHRARRDGDRPRAKCLDRKLTQVHSAQRRIARHVEQLREGGGERVERRAMIVVEVLARRLRTLDRNARTCGREVELGPPGVTRVEVDRDPRTPRADPTELPWDRGRDSPRTRWSPHRR